jgi:superfamily II DNA or RNA helicase
MTNNEKKDKVQQEALSKWLASNKKGTCEIITGLGKTFIGLHALYTMPKSDKVHLFLAETTDRKRDVLKDIQKYNKIFNRNVLQDYNLKFYCYQTAYKWKDKEVGLVIADEIHDAMSPSYCRFFLNNKYDGVIGLSATINGNTRYTVKGKEFTKGELLNRIAPIIFKYTIDEGQKEGTSRDLRVFVIKHKLDMVTKNIKAGNKKKPFFQSEYAAYDYWDRQLKRCYFIKDPVQKSVMMKVNAGRRSKILYDLPSKVNGAKELLAGLDSKTIVFGNSLDTLLQLTPNVVSSKNSDDKNKRIRNAFDKGKINIIGSFKKLKQGANLDGLDNCVIVSYYGTDKDLIQRIGRLRTNGKQGNVFIFVTEDTQEEVWFSKMFENISNLKFIHCNSVEECIKKL